MKKIQIKKWDKYWKEEKKWNNWRQVRCKCECGKEWVYHLWLIRSWNTRSCWCLLSGDMQSINTDTLKYYRNEMQISQWRLADMSNISTTTYSKIENEWVISSEHLDQLINALNEPIKINWWEWQIKRVTNLTIKDLLCKK